jgi:DNA primase
MYKAIPEDIIENIRKENDIVSVVEEYVQLKKQGRNYFGLCPFHEEKSPSFSVAKDKQIFHCFGCGKGGNVISFLMEMETFTFVEAVTHLANRIGMALPEVKDPVSSLSEEASNLLSAHDWLTKYYHHVLKYAENGKDGLNYLNERGINEKTLDEFQLGFAPSNSDYTLEFLTKKGFHTQTLVKAGLVSTKDNTNFVDVFRGRVIYPIKNHLGRTVAFGGRAFQSEGPKYLNSPEHELFHKGNLLYNFHLAKNYIRKQQEVIVFEGYMDVISAHQAGIKNCVATLGTALTTNQAKLLKRYVDTVIICYDADVAGLQASFEAATLLRQLGCEVKVASVKNKMDPDDYIKKYGGETFLRDVIEISQTYFGFYMFYKRKQYNLSTDSERIAYIEDIIEHLALSIHSPIAQEYYVKEIAAEFNLSTDIIYHDIEKHKGINNTTYKDNLASNSNTSITPIYKRNNKPYLAYEKAERTLLCYMFKYPEIIDKVQDELGIGFNIDAHKIILTHLYALHEKDGVLHVSKLIDKLTDEPLRRIVTEIAMMSVNEMMNDQEINDYIQVIGKEKTEHHQLRLLKQKQKQETNPFLAAAIGTEIVALERRLKQR